MSATTLSGDADLRGNGHASEKLRESRSEFQHLFDPGHPHSIHGEFPRSKTMQLLLSKRGAALLAVAAGAVLIMKPALAARAARVVPISAVLKSLAINLISRR